MHQGSVAAPSVRPLRTVRIGRTRYPVVLPKLRDSRLHVAAVVITLHTLGQVGLGFHISVPQILSAILTCALIQVAVTFVEKKSFVWPASAMLTGSGIALILRVPSTPVGDHWTFHKWWVFSGIAAFSLLTKFVIKRRGTHVFNPSNLGLVLAFIIFGSSQVEPLDFWWAPMSNRAMPIAYAVILIGGTIVAYRLGLLTTVVAFFSTLVIGTAITAAAGSCFTARWSFAPVCGTNLWLTLVTSPEILIFTYFMITDPQTIPRGRVGRTLFGTSVGVICVVLMAPQQTEFGAKVALLSGLTIVYAIRPFVERFLPEANSAGDSLRVFARRVVNGRGESATVATKTTRLAVIGLVAVLGVGGISVAGHSARGMLAGEPESIIGRLSTRIDPSTFPDISVDQEVVDWNHEIDLSGAQQIVFTMAENLEIERQALLEGDVKLLESVDHGDRLDAMTGRVRDAVSTGTVVVNDYAIDNVRVTLLIPFGRQTGLSLGMISRGVVTSRTLNSQGDEIKRQERPFETMWAVRRATGDRWLIVAELPVPAER